jgi:hypothetical protein
VAGLTLDVRVRALGGRELARFAVAGATTASRAAPAGDGCCLVEVRESSGRVANPRDRYTLVVGR